MPVSEASTSRMNCLVGSGMDKTGADVNRVFSLSKAVLASGDQVNGIAGEVKALSGAAT